MSDKKRRTRTGCLTCRVRRVKCDEASPTCMRCESSNVECLGYEKKRHIGLAPKQQRSRYTAPKDTARKPTNDQSRKSNTPENLASPSPHFGFRSDGLPLVGLPNNPTSSQRPHQGAREILAYHQYLFRTLHILFPINHLYFWRDRICEAAWQTEYLYYTIIALGGIHRAVLLISSDNEHDRARGMDTKVIALQAYIKALQKLSESLSEAERSKDILVGNFLLLAFIESFVGNVPAALRHVRVASHYFSLGLSTTDCTKQISVFPIECCLQNLQRICCVVLPVPTIHLRLDRIRTANLGFGNNRASPESAGSASSTSNMLMDILHLSFDDIDIMNLIWNPMAACVDLLPEQKIYALQERIRDWKTDNSHLLPNFDSENTLASISSFNRDVVDGFQLPPRPYPAVPLDIRCSAALYNFYMARTMWALSVLGCDLERCQLLAWIYSYDVMRWSCSAGNLAGGIDGSEATRLPCETLNIGFLPILHNIGQISPSSRWLRCIIEQLNHRGQEGLFTSKILSESLETLHNFEMGGGVESFSTSTHLVHPRSRVLSVLLPEENGRGYTAFFAGRKHSGNGGVLELEEYHLLGQARWPNVIGDDTKSPLVDFYDTQAVLARPLTKDWLNNQDITRTWIEWACNDAFNLDQILRDHINGGRL